MPLYEYQCKQCSDRIEIIQKMSDPPHEVCAKCGGEMKKLFSSPAIQFKGSGFYKTDYASGSKTDGKSSTGTESKSGDSKGDSGSGSAKPDTASSGAGKSDSGSSSGSSSSSSGSSTE